MPRSSSELVFVKPSDDSRFWGKVTAQGDCWQWQGNIGRGGYGYFWLSGRMRLAHRIAYFNKVGDIPEGMHVDHTCFNPACVNPTHLRVVTRKQNMEHRKGPAVSSRSGVRGVYWAKDKKKWRVVVMHNNRRVFGGHFSDLQAADVAAKALRKDLFTHDDAEVGAA